LLFFLLLKILPGLYIGSLKDAQDRTQLKNHAITHVVSVIEDVHDYKYFKVNKNISKFRGNKVRFLNLQPLKGHQIYEH